MLQASNNKVPETVKLNVLAGSKSLSLSLCFSSLCLSPIQEEKRKITPGPSTGAVIGGILGALVFIGIISGIIIFFFRKRQDGE